MAGRRARRLASDRHQRPDAPARRAPDYDRPRRRTDRNGSSCDLRIRGFWLMARGSVLARTGRDGVVTYSIKYRLADGTQVKRAIGPSRREAERALTKALAAVDRGGGHEGQPERRSRATREWWLAEHRPRVEAGDGSVDYGNTLQNHLIPYFGKMRLSAITPEHVRAYVAAKAAGTAPVREQPGGRSGRIKRQLAVKTINNQVTTLALILGHAAADGLIARNPATGRDRRRPIKLKEPHRERDHLRPHEVPVYLQACSDSRAMTLILTGCRIGELLGLRWDDVDWQGSAIIIGRAVKLDGVGSTKGDETGRRVDMGPRLAAALRDHRARLAEKDIAWDQGLVFPGPRGGHDSAKRLLDYEHRPALRDAGLRTTLVTMSCATRQPRSGSRSACRWNMSAGRRAQEHHDHHSGLRSPRADDDSRRRGPNGRCAPETDAGRARPAAVLALCQAPGNFLRERRTSHPDRRVRRGWPSWSSRSRSRRTSVWASRWSTRSGPARWRSVWAKPRGWTTGAADDVLPRAAALRRLHLRRPRGGRLLRKRDRRPGHLRAGGRR